MLVCPYMRLLGIDYGTKKTGIAVSDETGQFAFPKRVFTTGNGLVARVFDCVKEFAVEGIVIGESHDYQGKPNKIMNDVLSFKKELEGVTKLPVYLEPEYMTSAQAERLQKELGGKKVKKGGDSTGELDMLDATAAAFILQSFLDKRRNA